MIRAGFNDQTTKIGKDNLKACFNELKTASSSSAVDAKLLLEPDSILPAIKSARQESKEC